MKLPISDPGVLVAGKSVDVLTAELAESPATQEEGPTGGAASLEGILAGVLADVMHAGRVPHRLRNQGL